MKNIALLVVALLSFLGASPPARAQLDNAQVLSAAQIAQRIQPLHPKTLVLVFDVTQSTRAGGVFSRERAGAATLIEDGCRIGDRIVLLKFGTAYKTVFDKTLAENADKQALVDQIPPSVEPGRGTNIRWPHHEALKMVDKDLPRQGVIVLLTDSFNDRPAPADLAYPDYLDYYTLKGLTDYPKTRENRDYERLLRTLAASGRVKQYGIGVGIAPDGRPIERLPRAGQGDDAAAGIADTAPVVEAPVGTEQVQSSRLPLILSGLLLLLLLLALLWRFLNRPVPLRLRLGDKGMPRDYRLLPGAKVGLGGSPITASPGDDVFPLAGVPAPAAFVQAARGGAASLVPSSADDQGGLKILHNGLPLERPGPVRVGDEVRLVLPATDSAPAREHRVHVTDPR